MQGRGSALPHAIRSARSSMQRPCACPPMSHGTCIGAFMPPRPSIGSSRARPQVSAWLVPRLYYRSGSFLATLHLVRPPRHLPLASRPLKAALCGAVGRRPHWQRRQSSCGAAVGSPPNELRPALAVRPTQSLRSRTCPRPRHSPPRQCSAHTLDGWSIPRSRERHASP